MPKLVETAHYHLWTDALHAQALAAQAHNDWDRGTYVRWAVTTAWTVLELACDDALDTSGIGNNFRRKLDAAVAAKLLGSLDWGRGLWQQVAVVHAMRKGYIHVNLSQAQLFPPVSTADTAIQVIREAVQAIYAHAGKAGPSWIVDSIDRGWDDGRNPGAFATLIEAGADQADPAAIKIAYVYKGREYVKSCHPPAADPARSLEEAIETWAGVPISAMRVYRGSYLIEERPLSMRGA